MRNNKLQESIIAAVLIAIAVFLLNPFNWRMPSNVVMLIAAGLAAVFAIYASFAWREQAQDEREHMLRSFSGRIAFLAGSGMLSIAIIVQAFAHQVDPWLVLALSCMVIAKIAGLWWAEYRH